MSVGLFEKNVINFLGNEQVNRDLIGIKNSTNGPRVEAAALALESAGYALNDDNLHGQVVFTEFVDLPGGYHPDWIAEFGSVPYTATNEQNVFLASREGGLWNIYDNDSDPLAIFRTSTPNNGREAKINGAEFAVQHFFGETGFGIQANYTLVRGDVSFNNLGSPSESQFALVGLRDTANLVGI